jgi:hypothetical protein
LKRSLAIPRGGDTRKRAMLLGASTALQVEPRS